MTAKTTVPNAIAGSPALAPPSRLESLKQAYLETLRAGPHDIEECTPPEEARLAGLAGAIATYAIFHGSQQERKTWTKMEALHWERHDRKLAALGSDR